MALSPRPIQPSPAGASLPAWDRWTRGTCSSRGAPMPTRRQSRTDVFLTGPLTRGGCHLPGVFCHIPRDRPSHEEGGAAPRKTPSRQVFDTRLKWPQGHLPDLEPVGVTTTQSGRSYPPSASMHGIKCVQGLLANRAARAAGMLNLLAMPQAF